MGYLIVPNFFAPKHPKYVDGAPKLHAISYDKCSFKCRYCNFWDRRLEAEYREYSADGFSTKIKELMPLGTLFKFTGGEPTLDPYLLERLGEIKRQGGTVFVDTNGSRPSVLKTCIEQGLIDVVGLSLKGLCKEDSSYISGTSNPKVCWEYVLDSLEICARGGIDVLVTLVCYKGISVSDLERLAGLLGPYPNILMKLNAWVPDSKATDFGKEPPGADEIENAVNAFLLDNPEWKSRIVLITNPKAVSDASKIKWS